MGAVGLVPVEGSTGREDGGLGVRRVLVEGVHAATVPAEGNQGHVRAEVTLERMTPFHPAPVREPMNQLVILVDVQDGLSVVVDPFRPDPAVLLGIPCQAGDQVQRLLLGHQGKPTPLLAGRLSGHSSACVCVAERR